MKILSASNQQCILIASVLCTNTAHSGIHVYRTPCDCNVCRWVVSLFCIWYSLNEWPARGEWTQTKTIIKNCGKMRVELTCEQAHLERACSQARVELIFLVSLIEILRYWHYWSMDLLQCAFGNSRHKFFSAHIAGRHIWGETHITGEHISLWRSQWYVFPRDMCFPEHISLAICVCP